MGPIDYIGLTEKIIIIFNKIYKTKKWNEMFTKLGDEIIVFEHDEDELYSQIQLMFSKENLESIAKDRGISGYELIDQIKDKLKNYFSENEVYSAERNRYIEMFVSSLEDQLKTDFPELYDKVFLAKFREEVKVYNANLTDKIEILTKKIDDLRTEGLNIKTTDELNNWYMINTKNECTLELFNHENYDFANKLLSQMYKNIIYIKAENIYECVAYISYIFHFDSRFNEFKELFRIVEDEVSWNQIRKSDLKDAIFINYFNNQNNLEILSNNKCIFVYGKNDYVNYENVIELEKRFFRNLIEKIKACKFSHEESYEIAKKSRNNYTILMRTLLLGKSKSPVWANKKNYKTLLPAMIINRWLDKDSMFIELLLEDKKNYKEYIQEISEMNESQDPFFVKHKIWNNNFEYMISDPEGVWDNFKDLIDTNLYNKLDPMIDLVLKDIDPKFDLPTEQHYYASLLGCEPQCSNELKNGFLETLIFLSRQESFISESIKSKIGALLIEVKSNKDWFSISEYLPLLFEINPEIVMKRLEEEIVISSSGLLNLFNEKSDGLFTGRNYYTHILWTLEKALFLDKYVFRAIMVITKLMDLDIEYKMTNTPINSLYNALVAWNHQYIYSIKEKIDFVRYIVENSRNGWLLLKELLPSNNSGYITNLSRPKYISYLLSNELKLKSQVIETYEAYYNIALDNINGKIENLCVLYEDAVFFNFGIYEKIKFKTIDLIGKCNDQEKYDLYKTIYKLISKNRSFQTAEWAQSIEDINKLESEILNSIEFKDVSYKYQYILEFDENILLNPIVYEDGDPENSIERNQKLEKELRFNAIIELENLKVSWKDFFSRFSKVEFSTIGLYLAEIKNDLASIEELSNILIENNLLSILDSYYNSLYLKSNLEVVEKVLHSKKLNHPLVIKSILTKIELNNLTKNYIDSLDKKYKQVFWENHRKVHSINEENREYALENYIYFANFNSLIEIASIHNFPTKTLIKVLENIIENLQAANHITPYHIQRIFKKIHKDSFPNLEISDKVMELEIYFFKLFDNKDEARYLKYNLSMNPNFVADIIKLAFKNEDFTKEMVSNEYEKLIAEKCFSILFSIKFSPTNNGVGEIDYDNLKIWCNKFIEKITDNKQKKIGMQHLGHFLANTNIVKEGEFPQESVKRVIEDIYDDDLSIGFIIEIKNSLGARIVSDGKDLYELSERYANYGKNSKFYPKTRKILLSISESYLRDFKLEKESAKYED